MKKKRSLKLAKPSLPAIPALPAVLRQDSEVVVPTEVPRITTDTIAAHREEVIGGARKYILRLGHTKHRILGITISLLVIVVISFMAYCTLALYRFQSTSSFMYRVSQVIPFPVAKAGSDYVSYESYLFEVRHYTHYYENQLKLDFNSPEGKQQLIAFKKLALEKVIDDAYVKKIAKQKSITVSDKQIDDQIALLRSQNRLGDSDEVFENVIRDYYGWSVADYRRSLQSQLLTQYVAAALDTGTAERANAALAELKNGADFAATAQKYSDEAATKGNGGDIGVIEKGKRDVSQQTTDALYKLKPGEYSGVINTGYSLEIVKNIETGSDGKIHAAHIVFNIKGISEQLNDLKDKQKVRTYIKA